MILTLGCITWPEDDGGIQTLPLLKSMPKMLNEKVGMDMDILKETYKGNGGFIKVPF